MSATWKNLPDQGRLIVTKYDDDGKTPLKGVSFTLTSKNDTSYEKTLTADENGEVLFNAVPCGDYILKEIKTIKGHTLLTDPIDVTLPLSMTEEEVNQKNVDKSKAFYSEKNKRYQFYSLDYNVTNYASLNLPNTGMKEKLQLYIPLLIGCALIVAAYYYSHKERKKKE